MGLFYFNGGGPSEWGADGVQMVVVGQAHAKGGLGLGPGDTPASAQMTESPININTLNIGMRVEGRVTRPPKSTPTKCRYAAVTRYDEKRRRTMKDDEERQVLEL